MTRWNFSFLRVCCWVGLVFLLFLFHYCSLCCSWNNSREAHVTLRDLFRFVSIGWASCIHTYCYLQLNHGHHSEKCGSKDRSCFVFLVVVFLSLLRSVSKVFATYVNFCRVWKLTVTVTAIGVILSKTRQLPSRT